VPRYRLLWLEIADQQYRDLPVGVRELVERRLARLLENPTVEPDAVYNERSDQWSLPLADDGFLFYAVVQDPATVIILRLIHGLT
jgi:hypothetical protein